MKYINAIILVGGFLGLLSCGDDNEKPKDIVAESAEWSVLVDEELVEGDKLSLIYVTDVGYELRLSQTGGTKSVLFNFFNKPKVKTYTSESQLVGEYSPEMGVADDFDEGQLIITKYNADSLVATFSYNTFEHRELEEGVIKAKLR